MFVMFTTNVVCHTQPRVSGHLLFYCDRTVVQNARFLFIFIFLIGVLSLLFLCLYD